MLVLLCAFFSATIATLLIIRYQHIHGRYTGDHDVTGIQKFHESPVPRIGGLAIFVGLAFAVAADYFKDINYFITVGTFLLCMIPAFGIGLTEDITKKAGVKIRLLFSLFSALLVCYVLNIRINRIDVIGIDYLLLNVRFVSIVLTCFAITGISNAYNIIDGFNGLASMVAILALLAIAYVALSFGDILIIHLCLIMIGAIAGFFIWNYPRGLIFLGDGGSYLIGLWIGVLSVYLVSRHKEISPWFALLVNAYPILETLFTIYRRAIHQGKNPGMPDAIHFHTLLYRRILAPAQSRQGDHTSFAANAKTSPYLWVLSLIGVAPAMLWWNSTPILMVCAFIFTCLYIWIYKNIVRFKTPKYLK